MLETLGDIFKFEEPSLFSFGRFLVDGIATKVILKCLSVAGTGYALSHFYVISAFSNLRYCITFNSNINNTRNGIEAMGLCQASKVVLCDSCIERENKDGDPSSFISFSYTWRKH